MTARTTQPTGAEHLSKGEAGRAPRVSVLIATRNRPGDLVPCMSTVLALDHDAFDVLVLDQSDTDASEQAVRAAFGAPERLCYIRSATVGKSIALNELLRRAQGDLLAFTDDDTEVPADWLRRIEQAFTDMPEVDILYGQVFPGREEAADKVATPCLLFGERRVLARGEIFGMGANMAFRRSLVERIHGYDPVMGPGGPLACSEDFDLLYRAHRAGAKAAAEPSVQLVHRAGRTAAEWGRVYYTYGAGDAAFAMKHLRCGDLRLTGWLFGRPATAFARLCARIVKRRSHAEQHYLRGYWHGLRQSRRYPVDRRTRLYVRPG